MLNSNLRLMGVAILREEGNTENEWSDDFGQQRIVTILHFDLLFRRWILRLGWWKPGIRLYLRDLVACFSRSPQVTFNRSLDGVLDEVRFSAIRVASVFEFVYVESRDDR
jgi:hypothetical protein